MGAYVAVKAGYFSTHAAFPDIQEASSIGTYILIRDAGSPLWNFKLWLIWPQNTLHVQKQWFLHVRGVICLTESCLFLMHWCLRSRRPQASNIDFQPCHLCTEMDVLQLLGLLIIVCTVAHEIFKVFGICRYICQLYTDEPVPIFTSEKLRCTFHTH